MFMTLQLLPLSQSVKFVEPNSIFSKPFEIFVSVNVVYLILEKFAIFYLSLNVCVRVLLSDPRILFYDD